MRFVAVLLILLIYVNAPVHGQTTRFGIFAGPQATTADYKIEGEKQSTSNKYGFQLGAGWKIPFDNQLYFSPSAAYSMKGYKVKLAQSSFPPDPDAVDNNLRMHTFELNFLLQYDLGRSASHAFIKAGPSLDFQIKGNEKFRLQNDDEISRDVIFSFGDYGRVAASMLFQLGYETQGGLYVAGQYTHGIGSINNADHGPKILHRGFGLTVGYYLSKNKIVMDTRNRE